MLYMFYLQTNILTNYWIILDLEEKPTLRINPDQIPDLHWKLANTYHTTDIGQTEIINVSIHDITVNTYICTRNTSLSTETYTTQSRHEPLVCSVLPLT